MDDNNYKRVFGIFLFHFLVLYKNKRVECYFSPCCLGFTTLVKRFYFSFVGLKRFHRYHFSPLG
ncbi:hypothetical protein HanIR_Chr16g0810761 [Helianthus annuus]|nr:hypothetical protein HanIR_Chr16g0810761 [Helianthus annuus]